jgi:hypothetical protein
MVRLFNFQSISLFTRRLIQLQGHPVKKPAASESGLLNDAKNRTSAGVK